MRVYASIGGGAETTPAEMARRAVKAVEEGHTMVKIRMDGTTRRTDVNPAHDWAVLSEVRQNAWCQEAMRWSQVNMKELDAQRFDVRWWMKYFQRCHLDGITINAAGFVACYPSQVPLHPRSKFLGEQDLE